ncbi:MAG: ubiquitin-like domain-containing protein [Candidatus Microsaccharimonas sp.]
MASTQSGRLVTIHDRGEQKSFLSDAETVADALSDAGVTLDAHDAIEPALDQKLIAREYEVNIYRARPVIVIDGPTRQKVMTPYQVADRIVKDAGVTLYPEDTTSVTRTNDLVSDGAGLQLTIDRAMPMTLTLFGSKTEIRTQGETVGDMLREKGVELAQNDRASVALSTPIQAGMNVSVWREGKQTVTVQEEVAFGVEVIRDADQYTDYKAVQSAGQAGQRNATYEIEIKDGIEVSRVEIASLVTLQPVKQVEVVGVKVKVMPYTGGGTKTEWLAASNIPQESWGYADFMVQKESGWNPNAINKSSGACGLAQALPCSKVPGDPYNPVNSLNWMNSYVNGRYGGWQGAYNFWVANHWY